MYNIPVIEMKIRNMGEEVAAAIALRRDELDEQISMGIDRALTNAPEQIVQAAMEEATKVINSQVTNYFRYGPGYKAIQSAIETAMEPIRKAFDPDGGK